MLKDNDVDIFINSIPSNTKMLMEIIARKEQWPMDDLPDVNQAINELSDLLADDPSILVFAENAAALSSMALMKMPRALLLLSIVLKNKPNFLSEIIQEPGESGKDVQHKVIMVNRLVFMARTRMISEIFDEKNYQLIKQQLSEVK